MSILPIARVTLLEVARSRLAWLIGAALLGVCGLALRYALRGGANGGHRRLGDAAETGAVLALTGALAGALVGGAMEGTEEPPECW